MPYPNPAGYGLKMPSIFEEDITRYLDIDRLKQIVWDVAAFLNRDDQAFGCRTSYISTGFDEWVNTLPENQVIDLIRWLSEVLAAKSNPTNED